MQVLTTTQAAKALMVSQQTITRLFDSGKVKGFKIPGSTHRRILASDLERYAKENGIPWNGK